MIIILGMCGNSKIDCTPAWFTTVTSQPLINPDETLSVKLEMIREHLKQ
jgi:hypothetical protein